ncbi:MAG TPA: X2-like carbohydrate binding domain-containing protein, partial [Clostridia bacterium]
NENIISPEYTYIIPSSESSLGETHVNAASLSNISVDIGDKKLSSIMNGKGTLRDIDYYVSGSTVTIRESYIQYYFNKFPDHNLYLNFVFKDGSSSIFTVYTGNTPHVVLTDALSYKLGSGDAELSLSPNGNFIASVKNGNNLLVPRIDYTYSPSKNIFYIRKGYLNSCFSKTLEPLKIIVGFTGDSPKSVVITPVK